MSEYQYYEFQAIDRRLTDKQMGALRAYSSRAQITPTCFINEYSFGDFKGDEDAWMEKYFDAFLYLANWGTHTLQLRLPAGLIPIKTARLYCRGHSAAVRQMSGNLIFTFVSEEEGGGEWVEGQDVLSSILPARAELAQGDLRVLYIGWLLCAQEGQLSNDELEPPVPPNLGEPSRGLSGLIEFLRVDLNLLRVAAEASVSTRSNQTTRKEMSSWVASLPATEKEKFLVRLLEEESAPIAMELRSRFSRSQAERKPVAEPRRRTVGELLGAANEQEEKRPGHRSKAIQKSARAET